MQINYRFRHDDPIIVGHLRQPEIHDVTTWQVSDEYTLEFHPGHPTGYPIYIRPDNCGAKSNLPKIDTKKQVCDRLRHHQPDREQREARNAEQRCERRPARRHPRRVGHAAEAGHAHLGRRARRRGQIGARAMGRERRRRHGSARRGGQHRHAAQDTRRLLTRSVLSPRFVAEIWNVCPEAKRGEFRLGTLVVRARIGGRASSDRLAHPACRIAAARLSSVASVLASSSEAMEKTTRSMPASR
jgi:hypothetical protein